MFAFGSVNWARPTIHTLLHMPYMILRSRADQQPPRQLKALEYNVDRIFALEDGAATASERGHPSSDDDEEADMTPLAKKGRGVSPAANAPLSSRPVLVSGTSKAKQIGFLVKSNLDCSALRLFCISFSFFSQ